MKIKLFSKINKILKKFRIFETIINLNPSISDYSNSNNYLFILVISLILFLDPIYPQNSEFTFEDIPINENMPTFVHCIQQDRQGYLWFATNSGLFRYDGYSFVSYTNEPGNTSSLIDNKLTFLHEDKTGDFWVGTWHGFEKLDRKRGTFTYYHYTPDSSARFPETYNNVWSICGDKNGMLWIGTSSSLYRFDKIKEEFTCFQHDSTDPGSISHYSIYSIYEDKEGSLWIGTRGGLDRYNFETGKFIHYWNDSGSLKRAWYNDNSMYRVNAIFKDSKGIIWLGAAGGLVEFNPKDSTFFQYPLKFKNDFAVITSICQDHLSKYLWVGTENRLFLFDKNSKIFTYQNVEGNYVYCETSGTLWIGGKTGIKKLDRTNNPFKKYPMNNIANEIRKGINRSLWICDYSVNKYLKFDINKEQLIPYSFGNNKLFYVFPEGDLAFIAKDSSFVIIDSLGNRKFCLNPSRKKIIPSFSFLCKNNNGYWAGTMDGDLYFMKTQSNKFLLTKNFKQQITLIFEDRQNKLWIATLIGKLFCYDQVNDSLIEFIHNIAVPSSISSKNIYEIYEDKKGRLWFATNSGLNRFDRSTKTFISFSKKNGLQSNHIGGILEDSNGNLWLNTNKGISKFDPKTNQIKNFDVSYGVEPATDVSFSKGCTTENGEMYFGGAHAFTRFHPDSLKENSFIPQIIITSFKIFDKPYSITDEISLPYNENFISFEFAALSYLIPERNQYAYKMDGLDKNWIYSGTRRFASYPNLSPGEYIFKVKGSNNDGIWNEIGVSVKIIITPPWWQTPFAFLSYIIIIVLGIWGIVKFQMNRIHLQREIKFQEFEYRHLEEIEKMKSKFIANISHEFRTPLMLIKGPLEQIVNGKIKDNLKYYYEMILRNTEKLQNLIDQLLDLSKLEAKKLPINKQNHDLVKVISLISDSFTFLSQQKRIKLTFQSSVESIWMLLDRDKFEKVLNNLLSNAFKFTNESGDISIKLAIRKEGNNEIAVISVKDTGVGISEEDHAKIFDRFYQIDEDKNKIYNGTGIGLSIVKELVLLNKWNISLFSKKGEGSEFILRIPVEIQNKSEDVKTQYPSNYEFHEDIIDSKNIIEGHSLLDYKNTKKVCKKSTILYVEDIADVRNYVYDLLKPHYKVELAENAEKGLILAQNQNFDLIISDIMMPGIDGLEFCKRIKTDWKTSHIPIILLTAKATNESRIMGYENEADDYIIKPFVNDEILIRIKNLIQQRNRLKEKFSKNFYINLNSIVQNSTDKEFLDRVILCIKQNITNEEFNSEMLAHQIFISRRQLHRKLVALTNQTPGEFIRIYKLKTAAQLILENRFNVTQIALEVGFESPSQFTRTFKKYFDCLPSEYRKKLSSN